MNARDARPAMRARIVAGLFAIAAITFFARAPRADVHVSGTSDTLFVAPGATFTAGIVVSPADAAFNAFYLSVRFDPSQLTFVPATPNIAAQIGPVITATQANTFHVFSTAPDSVKADLSLLGNQLSVTGPGVIYQLAFRAGTQAGYTTLLLGPYTRFLLAGIYQTPVDTRPIVVQIGQPVLGVGPPRQPAREVTFATPSPDPAHRGGALRLAFELPRRERVRFDVLDALGRRIVQREPQDLEAGPHQVSWTPPALPSGRYLVVLHTASGERVARGWTVVR